MASLLCEPAPALDAADDECAQAASFVEELGLDEEEDPPTARGDDGTMVSILRHPLLKLPWVRNRGVADGTLDGEQSASLVSELMQAAYELTGSLRAERSKYILNEFRFQCDAGAYAGYAAPPSVVPTPAPASTAPAAAAWRLAASSFRPPAAALLPKPLNAARRSPSYLPFPASLSARRAAPRHVHCASAPAAASRRPRASRRWPGAP